MKKGVLLLEMLALMAAITLKLAGCSVSVDDGSEGSAGLEYRLSEDGSYYTVIGRGSCKETEIVIPGVYNELPVACVGGEAFKDASNITDVKIPDSVTEIAGGAFSGCSSLTEITVPNSVIRIGEGAFSGCSALKKITLPFIGANADAKVAGTTTALGYVFGAAEFEGGAATDQGAEDDESRVYYIPSALEEVTVTGGSALGNAFKNCSKIRSVTLADEVTRIHGAPFSGCSSLESLTLPYMSETKDSEFFKAYKLGKLFGTKKYGGSYALSGIGAIYYLPEGLVSVTVNNGVIAELGFAYAYKLESVTFGEGVTEIGRAAMYRCKMLKEINLNAADLTDIGTSAFEETGENSGGITLNIGKSVSGIPAYAFGNDVPQSSPTVIKAVVFEEGSVCSSIGEYAFGELEYLESVNIPDSVTRIGTGAFIGCKGLSEVKLPSGVTIIEADTFSGCQGLKKVTLGKDVTEIRTRAFTNCGLESIIIPNSVRLIEDYAFYLCDSLSTVMMGSGVETIGASAFQLCDTLKSIQLPEGLKRIGAHAFSNTAIESIVIPADTVEIQRGAFWMCDHLTKASFVNKDGWRISSSAASNDSVAMDVSDALKNAQNLTGEYENYYWYCE
ncbi:MAG: leucine-rich repeat domain-containing protein [Clostridia bacterium]|nr:leucine-rich repeat domain-containing protein [Clostridia bacterium]